MIKNNTDLEEVSFKNEIVYKSRVGSYLTKAFYIGSLVSVGLFFTSCEVGFVATEPVYVEHARPPQPSNMHIWVDGDWMYSRQTHSYSRRDGYWEKPHRGQTYVQGRWQSSPRGMHWSQGRWQRSR